jgi:opacity protein-like surface antigen
MKRIALIAVLAAASLTAPAAASAATQFEGTVVSLNRDNRTFRLHDSERGTIRIKVTKRTRFERIAGFSGLSKGMTRIEATVHRSNGRWVASEVERSGGGGRHGGDDD